MKVVRLSTAVRRAVVSVLDAIVVALAVFGAANLVSGALGGADRNDLWVRGLGVHRLFPDVAVACLATGVLGRRFLGRAGDPMGRVAALVLALLCALDAAGIFALLGRGRLASGSVMSLSLVLAGVLALWATSPRASGAWHSLQRTAAIGLAGAALVLLHLLTFGATDYRRGADAAVVFGSAVRSDGSPSGSLYDRTRTACRLYHDGLVSRLVLSGGRSPRVPISEPVCMALIARNAGVPEDAIILDETGMNSAATLAAVGRLARERGWTRVLLVSHDYHLARIHLLSRDLGVEAFTVPAVESGPWPSKPWFVFREVAAWTWHFLRSVPMATAD